MNRQVTRKEAYWYYDKLYFPLTWNKCWMWGIKNYLLLRTWYKNHNDILHME